MNVYLISQDKNSDYDTYDSAVVVAKDVESARRISPCNYYEWDDEKERWYFSTDPEDVGHNSWTDISYVKVKLIAELPDDTPYHEGDVILASFNAG